MQNGRNRIAARHRSTGKSRNRNTRTRACDPPPSKGVAPGFPREVKVATPPGASTAAKRRQSGAATTPMPASAKVAAAAGAAATAAISAAPRKVPKPAAGAEVAQAKRDATSQVIVKAGTARARRTPAARSPVAAKAPHMAKVAPDELAPAAAMLPVAPMPDPVAATASPQLPPALALPPRSEPLVVAPPTPGNLPRNRAVTRPGNGLVAAIAQWLRSVSWLTARGLLPRKARAPLPKPPHTLPRSPQRQPVQAAADPASELARLRTENSQLRRQLEALDTLSAAKADELARTE